MLVIRRKVTRDQAYTVLMMPDYYQEWPTSDYEHGRIMKVFKQDRPYEGILNDFVEYGLVRERSSQP